MSALTTITNLETQAHQKNALAIFQHEKTSTPERQLDVVWEQVRRLLTLHTIRDAKSGKGFVPAKITGTRANSNVNYVSLAVLDSDQGVPFDEGLKRLDRYDAALYTTHSHGEDHHKWRAVIRLETPVRLDDFPAFRAGLLDCFGADINDSQCNDAARFYYFPSCPKEKAHLRRTEILEGTPLDPAPLIERGRQILEQRRSSVTINRDLEPGINKPMAETAENIERVKGMLAVLDAACGREKWRNVGWALASLGWTCGFDLFDGWSKTAPELYDAGEVIKVWKSHKPDGGITSGTLKHYAEETGLLDATKHSHIEGVLAGANGDIVNGKVFARMFRDKLKFVHETKEWLKYKTSSGWVHAPPGEEIRAAKTVVAELRKHAAEKWKIAPDDTQTKRLMAHVERSSTEPKIHAMINMAKSESDMTVRLSEVDADPMLLGVPNGVIDLRTQALIPTTPEILVTKRCSIPFDPEAKATHLNAFIRRITGGNPELASFFQRFAGYILTGDVSEHCFGFFYGLGRNGKTTLAELLFWLLGDYAVILPTTTLMQSKRDAGAASPDLMLLKGRRLALATETDENARFAESALKAMTGGDTMTARNPYGLFASWTPTHKLLIVGNHRPAISGGDYGIWRRVKLIPFRETIADDECDGRLPEKLRSEGAGVLNWALAGLRDWQRQGLNPPKEVQEAGRAYQADMDIFGQWLDDHVDMAPGEKTATSDLYKAYTSWAKASGWLRPATRQAFGRRLTERGLFLEKAGNGTKFARGVRLNAEGRSASFSAN